MEDQASFIVKPSEKDQGILKVDQSTASIEYSDISESSVKNLGLQMQGSTLTNQQKIRQALDQTIVEMAKKKTVIVRQKLRKLKTELPLKKDP